MSYNKVIIKSYLQVFMGPGHSIAMFSFQLHILLMYICVTDKSLLVSAQFCEKFHQVDTKTILITL